MRGEVAGPRGRRPPRRRPAARAQLSWSARLEGGTLPGVNDETNVAGTPGVLRPEGRDALPPRLSHGLVGTDIRLQASARPVQDVAEQPREPERPRDREARPGRGFAAADHDGERGDGCGQERSAYQGPHRQ